MIRKKVVKRGHYIRIRRRVDYYYIGISDADSDVLCVVVELTDESGNSSRADGKKLQMNERGEMGHPSVGKYGVTLETIVCAAGLLQPVSRASVRPGDSLVIITCNSAYFLLAQEDGSFLASGGWFSHTAVSPQRVRINGCTWGGSAIKTDVVAAVGLNLEFGNRVVTSAIQRIFFFPRGCEN